RARPAAAHRRAARARLGVPGVHRGAVLHRAAGTGRGGGRAPRPRRRPGRPRRRADRGAGGQAGRRAAPALLHRGRAGPAGRRGRGAVGARDPRRHRLRRPGLAGAHPRRGAGRGGAPRCRGRGSAGGPGRLGERPERRRGGPVRSLRGNPWAILAALCLGFFMTLLDLTIVNIAIPDMIRRLGAAVDEVLWVVNAYTLVLAVLIITAGRLGDLFGPRRLFLVGVAVFTGASVACGLSADAAWLIAARVLQGVGAAIMMPQTMTLIIRVFPAERRGTAMGVWGAVAGLATIAGPTLGGLLVTWFDWRFIFFVNIPFGALALVLGALLIPADPPSKARPRFDGTGVLLATLALGLLAFGLVEGERFHWGQVVGPVSIPLMLALSAVLFAALLIQQRARQGRDPLVPFALFADRNYSLMSLNAALVSVAMLGYSLLFTIYLQSVLQMSALAAGLTMAPMSVLSMVAA